jgi:endo-alpha-1,4-polygalactosaminidase (GH114 family)
MRWYAHRPHPRFLFIVRHAVGLTRDAPGFLDVVDGLAQEDLSFHGEATADWFDRRGVDHPAPEDGPFSTAELGARLRSGAERRTPLFTIDYALDPSSAERARTTSRRFGFVPFVSRAALDRLPAAPR